MENIVIHFWVFKKLSLRFLQFYSFPYKKQARTRIEGNERELGGPTGTNKNTVGESSTEVVDE
jgi:hypothetical protein